MTEFTRADPRTLRVAKTVAFLARPLNRLTYWAAHVIVEDRLARVAEADALAATLPGDPTITLTPDGFTATYTAKHPTED